MPLGIDVGFSLQRAPSALVEYALGRDARSNGSLRRLFIQMQLLLYPCHQVHWSATSSLQVPHFLPSGHIDHGLVGRSTVMSHQTNVTMTTVFFCNRAIISTVPSVYLLPHVFKFKGPILLFGKCFVTYIRSID